MWTHWVTMKVHKISSVMNYVLGCSCAFNPLEIIFGSWCLGAQILFRSNCERRYINRFRTIPSTKSLISTVIALHTCYIRLSISISLFPFGSTTLTMELEGEMSLVEPDSTLIPNLLNSGITLNSPARLKIPSSMSYGQKFH